MADLGRLEPLDPRQVWSHEAQDFTPWLLDNADTLAEALGLDIELTTAEHPVGDFALDLVGRDLTNDCVLIVENQLSPTDHGHLGQLITYAAGTDAHTIVWLSPTFREEHCQALDYLNTPRRRERPLLRRADRRGAHRQLQARTNVQPARPTHRLARQGGRRRQAHLQTGRQSTPLYEAFWTRFLERVHAEHPRWTNARKPQTVNWLPMPCPFKGGSYYCASFAQNGKLRTELYIDAGDEAANAALFERLATLKDAIETACGKSLAWEDLPNRRACRIADYSQGEVSNRDQFDAYIDWFFDSGTRLRAAFDLAATKLGQAPAP
jgi:hypothetical protein